MAKLVKPPDFRPSQFTIGKTFEKLVPPCGFAGWNHSLFWFHISGIPFWAGA